MNDIELAKLFVEYSETKAKLAELAMYIETAVLEKGETVKLAGITASYYKPSYETPDYEVVVFNYEQDNPEMVPMIHKAIDALSTTKTTVQWSKVVQELGIVVPTGPEKPARVVIK